MITILYMFQWKNFTKVISAFFLTTLLTSCLISKDEEIEPLREPEIPEIYAIQSDFDFDGTIARWPRFSPAAASITFDDGTLDQYSEGFSFLEEYGIKGTFFLAASLIDKGSWMDHGTERLMMSWKQAKEIAEAGHEIGSHSMNHIDLSDSSVNLETELAESRRFIEKKIPGITVATFCWPHWRETDVTEEFASHHYIAARSGNGLINYYRNRKGGIPSDPPESMYRVNAFGFLRSHADGQWKALVDDVYEEGSWFVSSYHGILSEEGTVEGRGWNALSRPMFEETIAYQIDKGFWIDSFGNVSRYIYERDSAVLQVANKGRFIELSLDDGLDNTMYDQNLSIRLSMPPNWSGATGKNDRGDEISLSIDEGKIYLELLPDGQTITIKPY